MADRLALSRATLPAGCPTRVRDPLWKATPSAAVPRPLPNGNFPAGTTFRLGTPERVGIGVRVNEFKPPETESWRRSAHANGTSFARGHRYFDHYSDMQQRAQLLVPTLQTHSRVDELNRVWAEKRHDEARRDAYLALVQHNERLRSDRLTQTKGLLRSGVVEPALRQVCSLPALVPQAFGAATPAAELMNRRVDVNRFRATQRAKGPAMRRERRARAEESEARLDEVLGDLSAFESAHLPEVEAMRTTTDWSSKLPRRRAAAAPAGGAAAQAVAAATAGASPSRFTQAPGPGAPRGRPRGDVTPAVAASPVAAASLASPAAAASFSFNFDEERHAVRFEA